MAHSPQTPAWTENDLAQNPHSAPDKAVRVRSMFDSISHRYDLNNRLHSFWLDQRWRRKAVAAADVHNGKDRVLDAACGTGDLSILFAEAGAAEVVGVDFSDGMLDIARSKAGKRKLKLSFQQADVTALPFDDHAFDIVSIAFGLRNVQEPQRALTEFRRVLRPGGRVVILEFSQPRNRIIRAFNSLYTRRIMPMTATLIAGDHSGAYRYLPRSIESFPEGEAQARLIQSCGFVDVSMNALTFGVCTIYLGFVPTN